MSVRVPEKEGEVAEARGAGARRRGEGDGFVALLDPAAPSGEDVPDPSEDVVSAPAARPLVAAYAAADRAGDARHDADAASAAGENARASASAAGNDAGGARADTGATLARLSLARRATARPVSPRIPTPHAREPPRTSVRDPNLLSRKARTTPRACGVGATGQGASLADRRQTLTLASPSSSKVRETSFRPNRSLWTVFARLTVARRASAGRSLGARAMEDDGEEYAFDFEEVVDDVERAASDFLPSAHDAIPSSSAPSGDADDLPRGGAGSVRTDAFEETLRLIPLPEGADEALRLDFKSRYFDPARALAAKQPALDPPRKVRPLENVRRFRRLLPTNDPARLELSRSRKDFSAVPGRSVTDETKTLADRAAAAANARDRAEKFRAQGEAARARVPVLQTLLQESVKEKGPLSLLARAMEERRRVRVRTRHASGVRGEAYAYVKAFDRHLNLILADVTETSSQRARIQRRCGTSNEEGKTKNAHKLVWRTRRLAQIFVRGEQVVLVAVEGDREEGGT